MQSARVLFFLVALAYLVNGFNYYCRPIFRTTALQCSQKIPRCAAAGITMKWNKGCTGKKDGGCQCNHYCAYGCFDACTRDSQCFWRQGTCYKRIDGLPGVQMKQCYEVTARPSVSPTTSKPSKSPTRSPTRSPTPPTTQSPSKNPTFSPTRSPVRAPTNSPTTSKPTQSPSSSIPTKSPTSSIPTKSPSFTAPTKSPTLKPTKTPTVQPACSSCSTAQVCTNDACVTAGKLQFTVYWERDGQMKMWVITPTTNNYVGPDRVGPTANTNFGQFQTPAFTNGFPTGPQNIFWASNTSPITGFYKVCVQTFFFDPAPSVANPVVVRYTVWANKVAIASGQVSFTSNNINSPDSSCSLTGGGLVVSYPYEAT